MQAANAIPSSGSTVARWIKEIFLHFELQIIKEIRNAKLHIFISFDGWGSKLEKLSVLSILAHFIWDKYEAVTCLIILPELPNRGKSGVSR